MYNIDIICIMLYTDMWIDRDIDVDLAMCQRDGRFSQVKE